MKSSTESTDGSDSVAPFDPDLEWLDAFEAQTTGELIGRARRYATRRARFAARAGIQLDPDDLVIGVLDDTRAGVLRWEPARCSLETHVIISIKCRVRNLRLSAQRHPHRPIDPDQSSDAAVEAALRDRREVVDESLRALATETLAMLRGMAQDDREVIALLDAYERDAFSRQEVIATTMWSKNQYRNVRLRLDRMVDRLDPGTSLARARA